MIRRFINISGSGASGCSALSEFLLDYEDCYSMGDFESTIFRGDGGIRELYHMLFMGDIFLETSAIVRFKNLIERTEIHELALMQKASEKEAENLRNQLKKISQDFLAKITEKDTRWGHIIGAYNLGKLASKCKVYHYPETNWRNRLINLLVKLCKKINHNQRLAVEYDFQLPADLFIRKDITKIEFVEIAKEFLRKYFALFSDKKKFFISIHFLSSFMPQHYAEQSLFFDDIKNIFIIRDPRSNFLSLKRMGMFFDENVDDFIAYYRHCHRGWPYKHKDFLCVRLEDFLLKHEETSQKVLDFVGISKDNKVLHPQYSIEKSRARMNNWQLYPNQKVMDKIANELRGFLYE
ncbi:MAG: hypothetical protein IJT36_05270 [Alphaproteobacteria bacterium]|nr:hypothetical protein [Alphaproteobacteria bacterium]